MPRTEGQFVEIREQKINLIMQTALELFANEGYYPTSISRIAQKAGISKGLMYNYFASKEDLIMAIISNGIEILVKSLDANHDGFLTEDEFEFYINETFRILQENMDYWKLYFATMMQPTVFKIVMIKYADLFRSLTKLLKEYFKRKGVPDPEVEASYFTALLDGIFLNYVMNPEGFQLERIKKMIIQRFK